MIVMKFGGTSLADEAAIENACNIVANYMHRKPFVVVSALAGVTDDLVEAANLAEQGEIELALQTASRLTAQHVALLPSVKRYFRPLFRILGAVKEYGHLTPEIKDRIYSIGEAVSSLIFTDRLSRQGLAAVHFDATKFMITDDTFGEAVPQLEIMTERLKREALPHLSAGKVAVMGGYIGATRDGLNTTFGRDGSDFSASLVGAALKAEQIQIWTDVDGIMTANPRTVPDAQTIFNLTFRNAAELAFFGGKLHPKSLEPAERLGIPIRVRNYSNPEHGGTLISRNSPNRGSPIISIACKKDVEVVTVQSNTMNDRPGFLARLYQVFAKHDVPADVVTTSEVTVSTSIERNRRTGAFEGDLRDLGKVTITEQQAIIAIVINERVDSWDVRCRALASVEVAPAMVSQGDQGSNLSLVVHASRADDLVRKLHREFFAPVAVS